MSFYHLIPSAHFYSYSGRRESRQRPSQKEVSVSKSLSKAGREHDVALANVKSAEADLRVSDPIYLSRLTLRRHAQMKKIQEARLHHNDKKAHVEAATQHKESNDVSQIPYQHAS